MADVASDHPQTAHHEPPAAAGQVVMHPAPCAACGARPEQAQWVLIGDPAQWVCSPTCLKVVMEPAPSTTR